MKSETLPWDLDAERELLADGCRRSLWLFVKYAFGAGLPDNPLAGWLTDYHRELCDDFLQPAIINWFVQRTAPNPTDTNILICAHRDSGKTVIVTKATGMWIELLDPELCLNIDSETQGKSEDFLRVIRRIYEGKDQHSLFAWLFGVWKGTDVWKGEAIVHAARSVNRSEPSFGACSIESGITGYHPDVHITDDPLSAESIKDTGLAVSSANVHMDAIIPAMKAPIFQVLVGTPYVEGDPVTRAIREGISKLVGLDPPREIKKYLKPEGRWILFWLPARDEHSRPTVPKLNSEAKLTYLEEHKNAVYQSQYKLMPGAGENVPLTFEQISGMYLKAEDVPWQHLTYSIHLDTALFDESSITKGDETVVIVWGHHPTNGDVYYREGYASRTWRAEDLGDKLVDIVSRLRSNRRRVRSITDERTNGGKHTVWRALLKTYFRDANVAQPPLIEFPRQGKAKLRRIRQAAGFWADGHVHLVTDAPGVAQLHEQMSKVGVTTEDDWADAAADCFNPAVYRVTIDMPGQRQQQPEVRKEQQQPRGGRVARSPIK